jgi:hypothetical protein
MNTTHFAKFLAAELTDLDVPFTRFTIQNGVCKFTVDTDDGDRVPVTLEILPHEDEVDVILRVGSKKKIVSTWADSPKKCAEMVADNIYYLSSGFREREMQEDRELRSLRFASRDFISHKGLTLKQANTIALAMRPLIHQQHGKTAVSISGIIKKVTSLIQGLSREPKAWTAFKEAIGATAESASATEIGKLVWDFASKGKKTVKDLIQKITNTFPLNLYFVPKNRVPTLTDLINHIMSKAPKGITDALAKVNDRVIQPVSDLLDKYLPTLQRPIIAALFAWIWVNATEISWDFKDLIRGFTGAMSLAELFSTLPESGVGLIMSMFGVGFQLLPVMILARILWLVGNHYLEWKNGKLSVRWDKLGVSDEKALAVPVN